MSIDKIKNMSIYINGLSTKTGQELTRLFSANGARLFLSDINEEKLLETENRMGLANSESYFLKVDLRDPYQVENVINKAYKSLKTLDCAINNFSLQSIPTNIIDCSVDFLVRTCMSSLSSVFLLMKYEISLFLGLQGRRTIINIFSTDQQIDLMNSHATTSYLHAIKGLTIATSNSYADSGIKIKSFFVQYDDSDMRAQKKEKKLFITDLMGHLGNVTNEKLSEKILKSIFDNN